MVEDASRYLTDLTQKGRYGTHDELSDMLAQSDGVDPLLVVTRRKVLDLLFRSHSSDWFSTQLLEKHISPSRLPLYLQGAAVDHLLKLMVKQEERFRFQLAVMLSQIDCNRLGPEVTTTLGEGGVVDGTITLGGKFWKNCLDSELYMERALEKEQAVVVNNSMVIKREGTLVTGICVAAAKTLGNQMFVPGVWYSPEPHEAREEIKTAINGGQRQIELNGCEWVLIRPVWEFAKVPGSKVFAQARQFAQSVAA